MTLPALTIIPAGAGSGKTHSIEVQLGAWVTQGLVKPERIVAVTFTEAAAAELRQRIGARLLGIDPGELPEAVDPVDLALRLEQAYISTIHGFGLRVLTEFAFESGSSPQPRLLNEDEQNALIRLASSRTELANEITANLAAYGYRYEFGSEKGPEEVFRDDLLEIVELLRSVGWRSTSSVYAEQAVAWIVERYGPTGEARALSGALKESVEALLEAYPHNLAPEYGSNDTAKKALQKDFRNLNGILQDDALESEWGLWQGLRELRQSKKGSALPARYDELSSDVMTAANALPTHPGPLAHARRHVEALLGAGQEVLVYYEQAKRAAGLVDYSDMIALAGRLLREQPAVLATLKSRVDCLVVDEFQDTNPLQFALVWQLAAAGVPTLVVGDLKQAIMGFQGADPRLFEALAQQHPDECKPLEKNWRSQPRLMAFVNALGPRLFGDAYIALAPQRTETEPVPLEVVSFTTKAKKDQHLVRAVAVGERFKALLEDSTQTLVDRHTKQTRRLKGGDIAVLCPTHDMLAKYAAVLRAQGHRVRLQADGWYASRAVEIARYALSYLANPADRHAALYLAVTELGSLTLQQALTQLMEAGRIEDPVLAQLDTLAEGVAERTVYTLIADVVRGARTVRQRPAVAGRRAATGEPVAAAGRGGGVHGREPRGARLRRLSRCGRADVPRVAHGAGRAQGRRPATRTAGAGRGRDRAHDLAQREGARVAGGGGVRARQEDRREAAGLEVGLRVVRRPVASCWRSRGSSTRRSLQRPRATITFWSNSTRWPKRKRDDCCTWRSRAHATSWCSSGRSISPAARSRRTGRCSRSWGRWHW